MNKRYAITIRRKSIDISSRSKPLALWTGLVKQGLCNEVDCLISVIQVRQLVQTRRLVLDDSSGNSSV